ncbi:MAG: UDP-3-O-(3-hydroxymyristoyl)glucosamine N-acyltransferase [Putridiphycobacter sp.]
MKFDNPISLKTIAEIIDCDFMGNAEVVITGINEIHKVEPGDIVFVDHPKYYKKALNSKADVVIINKAVKEIPEGKAILISEQPFDDFNKITRYFRDFEPLAGRIGQDAFVDETAIIYPNVTIGNHVKIGKNTIIYAGVVLNDYTHIGDNVVIGANSVIGHNAFYYKKKPEGFERLHTCGRTIIEKDVELGALVTIDRGVTGDTIIGEGTKIDNQVQIGHDTVVGKNCLFAANVGVAGCVIIEDHVTLWGQVGVTSDVVIGENVTVHAQSGVSKSLEANGTYFGSPCTDARKALKEMAALRKLPSIIENL